MACGSASVVGKTSAWQSLREVVNQHHYLAVFVYLLVLETLLFGIVVNAVGFYLDDWAMIAKLKFAPQDFFQMIGYYFINESRVVNRPVNALHFCILYKLCGLKPLMYHVVNGLVEVLAGWLFYVCAFRVSRSKFFALVGAALFVAIPIHDATHYWVVASSVALSMALYLGSVALTIEGVEKRSMTRLVLAAFLFGTMLFNYELFMPLLIVNAVCAYTVERRQSNDSAKAWKAASIVVTLLGGMVVAYVAYLKFLVPLIAPAWVHAVSFDPINMGMTLIHGLGVTLSLEPVNFAAKWVGINSNQFSVVVTAAILGAALLTGIMTGLLPQEQNVKASAMWRAAYIGFITVAISFTIFGFNAEYQPTLITIMNRINAGASLGACVMYAAFLGLAALWLSKRNNRLAKAAAPCTAALLILAFGATDFALSRPWVLSQTMQRHVIALAKQQKETVTQADAIFLANSPRYVQWAPVFDGVWDFQNAMRTHFDNENLAADVVSERLAMDKDGVSDTSHGFVCGRFPLKNVVVIDAPRCQIVKATSATEFIEAVKAHGMSFELDRGLPAKWQEQLAALRANPNGSLSIAGSTAGSRPE